MKSRPLLLLLIFTILGFPAIASTLTQATSQVGSLSCTQPGTGFATCSQTQGFDSATSSATVTITNGSLFLDVIVNASHLAGGFNSTPSGTASASFNAPLVITGGTGTGILMASFFGFDDPGGSGTLPLNPVFSLVLGSTTGNVTPPLIPGTFLFTTPFTFGVPIAFQGSISGAAQAPLLMMNAASNAEVEGRVSLTGFTVFNSAGLPISGAVVSLVPEPSMFGVLSLLTLGMAWRRFSRPV